MVSAFNPYPFSAALSSRDLPGDSLGSPILKLEHKVRFGGVKKDARARVGRQEK